MTGAEYTGVAGADNQTVALKLAYGIARVPWSKLAPKTLLTISTSFIGRTRPTRRIDNGFAPLTPMPLARRTRPGSWPKLLPNRARNIATKSGCFLVADCSRSYQGSSGF